MKKKKASQSRVIVVESGIIESLVRQLIDETPRKQDGDITANGLAKQAHRTREEAKEFLGKQVELGLMTCVAARCGNGKLTEIYRKA